MDIDRYLARIKAERSVRADLATLAYLQLAHLQAVPFENLDIHYGRPISLDVERFFEKVVLSNRGGFCYELNGLFYELLQAIGFNVKMVSARVARESGEYSPAFDHLALVVSLENLDYLVDVGFGRFALEPLPVGPVADCGSAAKAGFQVHCVSEDLFEVCSVESGVVNAEYIFANRPRELSEFQEMCDFHQTSPDSPFAQKKLITILRGESRVTLTDSCIKFSDLRGTRVEDFDPVDFENYLLEYFGTTLSRV